MGWLNFSARVYILLQAALLCLRLNGLPVRRHATAADEAEADADATYIRGGGGGGGHRYHCSSFVPPRPDNLLPWVIEADEVAALSEAWGCEDRPHLLRALTAYAGALHGFGNVSRFAPLSNYKVSRVRVQIRRGRAGGKGGEAGTPSPPWGSFAAKPIEVDRSTLNTKEDAGTRMRTENRTRTKTRLTIIVCARGGTARVSC